MALTKKARVFVSFDYDHDLDLKTLLIGQARHPNSPFLIEDWSAKKKAAGWKADARARIRRVDVVIVICGLGTHQATGVAAEIQIAKEEHVRYQLLRGRKQGTVRRPKGTSWLSDEMHPWTWKELQSITKIKTRPWWTAIW